MELHLRKEQVFTVRELQVSEQEMAPPGSAKQLLHEQVLKEYDEEEGRVICVLSKVLPVH